MNANRIVGALVTGLCFVGYPGANVAAQVARFAARSNYPITIVSITGKPTGEAPGTSSRPLLDLTIKLRNATNQPVVCYAISFSWYDASGAVGSGAHLRYSGGDWTEPAIPAGGTVTFQDSLLQHSSTLKATVDFALLADGTYYGPDSFKTLDKLQKQLEATREVEKEVLSMLNEQGPDAVKRLLTSELAKGPQDQKLLHAKPSGVTDASFSYTP